MTERHTGSEYVLAQSNPWNFSGEALPQLGISLTFLYNEGTYYHPLTVLRLTLIIILMKKGPTEQQNPTMFQSSYDNPNLPYGCS